MKRHHASGRVLLLVLAVLVLPGCAARIPSSLPLAESEKPYVLHRLQEFQSRKCGWSLDADVTLEWQMYGKREKIPGMLQLLSPAFFRYAVVDPLGRQLFILVSDGNNFTLVDNRKAKALTGPVDSHFWRNYIPGFIRANDYISWLTGRLPAGSFKVNEIRADRKSVDAVWLLTEWTDAIRQRVLFHPDTGQVARHIVEGANDAVLLDVTYSDYQEDDLDCSRPRLLQVEGAEVSGTGTVHFVKLLPEAAIPPRIFHLTLPEHFTVTTVE